MNKFSNSKPQYQLNTSLTFTIGKDGATFDQITKEVLETAYIMCDRNATKTCKILGITRERIRGQMRKYKIPTKTQLRNEEIL